MRIDEGLGGTPADISVRIFGPDLDELARLAEQAERSCAASTGSPTCARKQLTGLPQLQIAVNRAGDGARRAGARRRDSRDAHRPGRRGRRRRSGSGSGASTWSCAFATIGATRLEAIRTLLIDGHDGTRIPLGQLADISQTFGPAAIRREAGTRRIAVEASVTRPGPRQHGGRGPRIV